MSSARAIVLTTMEPSLHGWLMIMVVDDSYSSVCVRGEGGRRRAALPLSIHCGHSSCFYALAIVKNAKRKWYTVMTANVNCQLVKI